MDKLKKIYDKYKIVFVWILLIGLMAHAFILTNKLVNHDELSSLFTKGETYAVGRWGLELLEFIFPNISMPIFNGLIALIFISLSACMVSETLGIENRLFQIIIGGIMITFPSIIGSMCYMYTVSSYSVSIFLSVISVYLFSKKKWKADIIGVTCLILSLSIYQAYVCITASLLILLLFKDCLDKDIAFKDIIRNAFRYLIDLILALAIYFISIKVVNYCMGIQFSQYQSFNTVGQITIKSLIYGFLNCYKTVFNIPANGYYGIAYNELLRMIFIIFVIFDLIIIILSFNKTIKESKLKAFLVLLLGMLLPAAMNMIFILNPKVQMHGLMTYANFIIILLPLFLYKNNENRKLYTWAKNIIVSMLIIIIYQYIILANKCYTKSFLSYENTYAFFNTLSTRIMDNENFDKEMKVALSGSYSGELLTDFNDEFVDTLKVLGPRSAIQLINSEFHKNFLKYYIGIDYTYASDEEIVKIKESNEYKNMNMYPYDNSIKIIDNVIVVKFE